MAHYYIPLYTPIYRLKDKLCVGFAHRPKQYHEFLYSNEIIVELRYILINGVTLKDKTPLIDILLNSNLLTTRIPIKYVNRGELLLEYLNNYDFDNTVKNCSILIFGAGAIGATLTYLLAQFGFNNISVADYDTVEDSDIQKTMVYDKRHKGLLKTEALANKINENFDISLRTYLFESQSQESINNLIDNTNPEIVIKACDPNLIFRVNLNKVCFDKNIPHFHISYNFENIEIGPLYIPMFSGCDNCTNITFQELFGKHYAFENHEGLFQDLLTYPSISFNINIVSNLALKEILFFLTGQVENCFSIGHIMRFNPISLSYFTEKIEKNKNCVICK
jgi:molybdopterin/thiamine biosynthesis adenylyltransferase